MAFSSARKVWFAALLLPALMACSAHADESAPSAPSGKKPIRGGLSGDDPAAQPVQSMAAAGLDYSGEPVTAPKPGASRPPMDEKLRNLLQKAGALSSDRRFDEASKVIQIAEALAPDSTDVLQIKAGILAESGHISDAREIYNRLAALNPADFVPKFNLGELLFTEKKYDEARKAFEALLEQFPHSDFLRFKILLSYVVQKNGEQAALWLGRLQGGKPTPFAYYGAAAIAISNGNIEEGKKMILAAENDFGRGRQALLHRSLADVGLVLGEDYPPQ